MIDSESSSIEDVDNSQNQDVIVGAFDEINDLLDEKQYSSEDARKVYNIKTDFREQRESGDVDVTPRDLPEDVELKVGNQSKTQLMMDWVSLNRERLHKPKPWRRSVHEKGPQRKKVVMKHISDKHLLFSSEPKFQAMIERTELSSSDCHGDSTDCAAEICEAKQVYPAKKVGTFYLHADSLWEDRYIEPYMLGENENIFDKVMSWKQDYYREQGQKLFELLKIGRISLKYFKRKMFDLCMKQKPQKILPIKSVLKDYDLAAFHLKQAAQFALGNREAILEKEREDMIEKLLRKEHEVLRQGEEYKLDPNWPQDDGGVLLTRDEVYSETVETPRMAGFDWKMNQKVWDAENTEMKAIKDIEISGIMGIYLNPIWKIPSFEEMVQPVPLTQKKPFEELKYMHTLDSEWFANQRKHNLETYGIEVEQEASSDPDSGESFQEANEMEEGMEVHSDDMDDEGMPMFLKKRKMPNFPRRKKIAKKRKQRQKKMEKEVVAQKKARMKVEPLDEPLIKNYIPSEREITIEEFRQLKIPISVMREGLLFIWIEKEYFIDVITHLESQGFIYVDQLTYMAYDPDKEELVRTLATIDTTPALKREKSPYFLRSKRTLLIMRRFVLPPQKSYMNMEFEDARDTIAEWASNKSHERPDSYVYLMIESMLKHHKSKPIYHQEKKPTSLEPAQLPFLELWARNSKPRHGWVKVVET